MKKHLLGIQMFGDLIDNTLQQLFQHCMHCIRLYRPGNKSWLGIQLCEDLIDNILQPFDGPCMPDIQQFELGNIELKLFINWKKYSITYFFGEFILSLYTKRLFVCISSIPQMPHDFWQYRRTMAFRLQVDGLVWPEHFFETSMQPLESNC